MASQIIFNPARVAKPNLRSRKKTHRGFNGNEPRARLSKSREFPYLTAENTNISTRGKNGSTRMEKTPRSGRRDRLPLSPRRKAPTDRPTEGRTDRGYSRWPTATDNIAGVHTPLKTAIFTELYGK